MKAILCHSLTGHHDLTLEDVKAPNPAPGEALIEVEFAALNFFDTLITKGKYQEKPDLPFSPGGEISGTIKQINGEAPHGLAIGDRVMAYLGWGGLQEQITVKPEHLIKIPQSVTNKTAASLIISYGTALHALMDRVQLKPSDSIAILGAAGGAGLAAVEVASAIGAQVITVASTTEKLELTKKHGATFTINSNTSNLKAELKALSTENKAEGEGVNVIYDCVGGDLAEPALRALTWNGHYLVVGFASGQIPKIPLNLVMLKGIHLSGVFLSRFIEEQPEDFKSHMGQLFKWLELGKIKPHIEAIYPLSETVNAIEHLASRKSKGKLLIKVSDNL